MFQLTFLGSGSAFTTENFQSNMLITAPSGKHLLIDCGGDARFSLKQKGLAAKDIDAVYISHLHNDHIGGLEWLGFNTYFAALKRPKMFIHASLEDDLWNSSLAGGMKSIEGVKANLRTFFDVNSLGKNQSFLWEGITFQLVQVVHIVSEFSVENSYGLMFSMNGKTIFITTDTQFSPNQISAFYDRADVIFHDVETGFKSGVHAHYEFMKTLPNPQKEKMWLYHYNDGPLPDAKEDGFCGFVAKGQVFG